MGLADDAAETIKIGVWEPPRPEGLVTFDAAAWQQILNSQLSYAQRLGAARGFVNEAIAMLDKRSSYHLRRSLDRALEALR